ncbi:MAG: peptidoglycan-associated lipoprotein Pal [Gallionella sp.]|nr:peptidoglycan-associated lipoprotein Pal [Gallionella sp.]
MKKLVISIVLVNLLAACASEKPKETSAAPGSSSAAKSAAASSASSPATAGDPLNDPASILAKRSVYYPFDVATVQDADKPAVQAHAKYLSGHANRKVRLEGNCDERGSNEYNLALGQRRADGVKKMLELGGAKTSQTESVSYGEEKPKASAHNEAAWAQNRRTDLMYAK